MTNYETKTNPEFNSTEITFDGKPSEAVRNILKDMRFRWHGVKKVWYGYKDEETVKNAIDNAENSKTKAAPKAEKKNKYGVKVGDIFSSSWGYEQTNVDFFQVIALVGECSVRVREVCPTMIDENPTCPMAADRTYRITNEILPPVKCSVFIKDQENGDLKRIRSFSQDPTDCCFNLSSFASAYICKGDTAKVYESWYA